MQYYYNLSKIDLDFLVRELSQPWRPIDFMTRNYYLRAVKYALSGIDRSVLNPGPDIVQKMQTRMSDKARRESLNPEIFMNDYVYAYNKYTAGWVGDAIDNFGTITKPDCPIDFAKWYDGYAYNGGHPFEIYPYVCLYVRRRDNVFYLELADFTVGGVVPSEKVLKMFIALRQAGMNVGLRDRDIFLKQLQNYNLKNR